MREQRERDERERQQEVKRRQREEEDRRNADEWQRKMEREKMKQEAEERKRAAKEQELREAEERDRERNERERRAKELKERQKMDAQMEEERRKKDDLLAKLRAIDEGKKDKVQTPPEKEHFFITKRQDSDGVSTSSSKKSYNFGKPIENMHKGKPSHEDVTVPYIERRKKNKERDDSDNGGYQPSFSSGRRGDVKKSNNQSGAILFNDEFSKPKTNNSQNKKSDLMSNLFGNSSVDTKSKGDDDLFGGNTFKDTKPKNTTNKSSFPWEDDKPATTTRRETSNSLFGGGSALFDDDNSNKTHDSSKILPKRPRQQTTTFQARPAVTAVDDFDDDLEEVIL